MDTQDKLLTHILVAAAHVNKCEDALRQTTHNIHTWAAKCTEVDGIFERLLWTVTNSSFKH